MKLKRSVRIVKKVQVDGKWKFVRLKRNDKRYVWDDRPGAYFPDWWDSGSRRREFAGETPSQALAAQKRKQSELIRLLFTRRQPPARPRPSVVPQPEERALKQASQTPIPEAKKRFLDHVQVHSPEKPETVRRYRQVMEHFERLLGHKNYVEAISRADIDEYKIRRRTEKSEQHDRLITAPTVNFEVGTLRAFFYYFINERGVEMENPCAVQAPPRC